MGTQTVPKEDSIGWNNKAFWPNPWVANVPNLGIFLNNSFYRMDWKFDKTLLIKYILFLIISLMWSLFMLKNWKLREGTSFHYKLY